MSTKFKLMIAGALVLVMLVAGIGGTIAFAQTPTPTTGKTFADLYLSALAQKLGTTVEKLKQAMTDANKDAATQAVKEGLLTQKQADAMIQRGQLGAPFGGFGGRGTPANDPRAILATAAQDAAAKTLGMTTADLTTALRTKTLLDLAREKNVDATKLRTAIADAQKAALDQAVKDGKISQAQADALKANIKPENIYLNGRGFGFFDRKPGMPGGQFPGQPGGQFPGQPGGRR